VYQSISAVVASISAHNRLVSTVSLILRELQSISAVVDNLGYNLGCRAVFNLVWELQPRLYKLG